jgi:hypothetical protein
MANGHLNNRKLAWCPASDSPWGNEGFQAVEPGDEATATLDAADNARAGALPISRLVGLVQCGGEVGKKIIEGFYTDR